MSIKVANIRLELDEPEEGLPEKIAARLGRSAPTRSSHWRILRKSLDARRHDDLHFSLRGRGRAPRETSSSASGAVARASSPTSRAVRLARARLDAPRASAGDRRRRSGGAVRRLSARRDGYRPLILERGRAVKDRVADVRRFDENGPLDPESNYLFGEGGAGTFSDGKLTSRGTGPDVRRVLEILADCHGKPSIVYEHRPHLGSNRLPLVVRTLRRKFEELGGEVRFSCRVEDLDIADGPAPGPLDLLGLHRRRRGHPGHRPQRPRHLRHAAAPRRAARGQAVPARRADRAAPGSDRPGPLRAPSPATRPWARPITARRSAPAAATCSPSACAPAAT